MTDEELIAGLEAIRNLLISVSTGGPKIDEVDGRYRMQLNAVRQELQRRGIDNPIRFETLWDWHGRWSAGDLGSWQSRRQFAADLVNPTINRVRSGRHEEPEPTGWQRVDRTVEELVKTLSAAKSEEQFQAVGLYGREALISLAQAVYDRARHRSVDGVEPSTTDARRMLDAYISTEMAGSSNEEARRHARSALEFAVALQHRRTATYRDAALCAEATTSVANVIAIVAGRRDPR